VSTGSVFHLLYCRTHEKIIRGISFNGMPQIAGLVCRTAPHHKNLVGYIKHIISENYAENGP
jgi:hypothetical protein